MTAFSSKNLPKNPVIGGMPASDTIASVTFIGDVGLVLTNPSHTTTTATTFVSGGVVGSNMNLTCRIVTTGGRTDDRSITLKILNR